MIDADRRRVWSLDGLLAGFNAAGVLVPVHVHAATRVGRLFGEDRPDVLLAAALALRGTGHGHVCLQLDQIRSAVFVDDETTDVDTLPWPEPDAWAAAIESSSLTGEGRPLVLEDGRLYTERMWRWERATAERLLHFARRPPADAPDAEAITAGLFADDGPQRHACLSLAARGVTVMAGGPGTGKTYTIARAVAMLAALALAEGRRPSVALAAPTGKAAARLTEAIRELAGSAAVTPGVAEVLASVEAQTIHRLLGAAWGSFRRNAANPLHYETVIVDEMSMVSLPMAARLLEAVPDRSRLMLVGDPDQLVSIEAGTVLGDIVAAGLNERSALAGAVHVLDRVHRFGAASARARFADAVRRGDADEAIEILGSGADDLVWIVPTGRALDELSEWVDPALEHGRRLVGLAAGGDIEGALAAVTESAVLCAHRRGDRGVEHWAKWIDDRVRLTGFHGQWYPGRPVMIRSNDRRMRLANGDIGVTVVEDDRLVAAFPDAGGFRTIGLAQLPPHEGVQAMTIHKSQGSQFGTVTVIVPVEGSRLLTRELLYTAATRATNHVRVVGEETGIRSAIERSVLRASGLSNLLIRSM